MCISVGRNWALEKEEVGREGASWCDSDRGRAKRSEEKERERERIKDFALGPLSPPPVRFFSLSVCPDFSECRRFLLALI